jgi:hypothetical protein
VRRGPRSSPISNASCSSRCAGSPRPTRDRRGAAAEHGLLDQVAGVIGVSALPVQRFPKHIAVPKHIELFPNCEAARAAGGTRLSHRSHHRNAPCPDEQKVTCHGRPKSRDSGSLGVGTRPKRPHSAEPWNAGRTRCMRRHRSADRSTIVILLSNSIQTEREKTHG